MFTYDRGIRLTSSELWLDAVKPVEDAAVSHAHGDHIRRHKHAYATPPTIELLRRRLGKMKLTKVAFNTPFEHGDARITFLPAGHILGSAQIRVESGGQTLLYSGDFNMRKNATAEPIELCQSDILIMETTFGHSKYRFPPRANVVSQLCDFVTAAFKEGAIPVVYAYALGKAQEAMHALHANGFRLCAHGSILYLTEVYKQFGHEFGEPTRFNANADLAGRVLVLPPGARKHRRVQRLAPVRSVFLTGWGMDGDAVYRYGVDKILPMSDHADYDELLQYVEAVNPGKIYTTHGPHNYHRLLRDRGYDADPLVPDRQTDLFD